MEVKKKSFTFHWGESCWIGAGCIVSLIEIFGKLIWDYSFIFHLNSCVLVILPKDLNFHKNWYIQALVYGWKPDLLGINVVDSVYYYSVYCYYKIIMIITHKYLSLVSSWEFRLSTSVSTDRGDSKLSPVKICPVKINGSKKST